MPGSAQIRTRDIVAVCDLDSKRRAGKCSWKNLYGQEREPPEISLHGLPGTAGAQRHRCRGISPAGPLAREMALAAIRARKDVYLQKR